VVATTRTDRPARADAGTTGGRAAWATVALGLLGCAAMYSLLFLPADVFDDLITEDGWIEMFGALALFLSAGLAVACLVRARRRGAPRLLQLSLLGLGLFFFAAGGEEISWGQRILDFGTPEDLDRINKQGEFNVHNVSVLGKAPELVFLLVWLLLAVAIPLVAAYGPERIRTEVRRLLPIVPAALAVLFVGNYVLAKVFQRIVDASDGWESIYPVVHAVTEIKETNFELLFLVAMVWLWRRPVVDAAAP
jgi:hypothetical protein